MSEPPIDTAPDGGPNNPRPLVERLITDLGARVAEVRRDLRDTTGVVAEVLPRLGDLERGQADLAQQVELLLDEEPAPRNAPVHWPTLRAEDAQRRWHELADWAEQVLVPWYRLTRGQLPDCWALHPRAVIELSWLLTCYTEAYLARSNPNLAAEWHTRWLRDALANIAAATPTTWCEPGRHNVHQRELQRRREAEATARNQLPPSERAAAELAFRQAAAQRDPLDELPEREQLAERRHWQAAWREAMEADVAARRQREASPLLAGGAQAATPQNGS